MKELDQDIFNDADPKANVFIEYILKDSGDSYDLFLLDSKINNLKDLEFWFVQNYSSRPVEMIGYCFKK